MSNGPRDAGRVPPAPDPITTEIIRNGFIAATEEMKTNLMRTAYNMIIYEALDFTVGLFDRHGNTVSIGLGLPMFIRGMSETIKAKLRHFGVDGIEPGDILLTNDAYLTGSHLNHMTFTVPVFHDGALIGFSACMAHWTDIGGTLDGMTTDIYSEGLQMPIVKAWRRGVPNEDILSVIRMNVRLPERAMGDLKAQVAAVKTGERHFEALARKYGIDAVRGAIESIFDHGEAVSRESVSRIPDGVYDAESFMDDDGVSHGERVPIRIRVTVEGDRMRIDLSEVSAQVRGFYNSGVAAGLSAAQVAFKCLTSGLELPINDGAFRNLEIVLPVGRVVSAERPAPMRWWMTYPMTIVDTIFKALAPAIPTRVIAGHHADLVIAMINGRQPVDGRLYLYLGGLIGGGWGAKFGEDGMSATVAINDGDTHNGPSEQVEAKYPLLVEKYGLREDSGGAGRHRGGLGTEQRVRARHDIMFNAQIERVDCRPWGLFGGLSAMGNEVRLARGGEEQRFPSGKVLSQKLVDGDVYTLLSGGGGGFGSPLERNLDDLQDDVRQGYVSVAAARRDYGAVFGRDGRIDRVASEARRAAMRAAGLPKDRPFASEDPEFAPAKPLHRRAPGWLQPHPEAVALARESAAGGLLRWRCC
ncbi:MAG: hydantoinase B/oxoprolinase family protein [Lautropia sp.]